jgi:hypothetical protein
MSVGKFNPRFIILIIILVAISAIRIPNAAQLTPWANYTPIGAMALFGGAYFTKKWKAILLSLSTLLVSDLIINTMIFHTKFGIMYSGWYWVYFTFLLITLMGRWLLHSVSVKNFFLASVLAAAAHWLILDFIVWAGAGKDIRTMLPLSRDTSGLLQCYLQGLPFAKYFLGGTLIYGSIMFGLFEWLNKRRPVLVTDQTILID